jgi:hypothetical protein
MCFDGKKELVTAAFACLLSWNVASSKDFQKFFKPLRSRTA